MASVSYQIGNLLEKMTSSDKDFRFMATNDLMSELQKDNIKLDDDSEKKVVKMLLRLLEDKNGEVQNLAVKCLGPLVNKVKEYQVETIVDALCSNMVSDKEQLRDISSIGLKTVISELPIASTTLAANVCKRITGRLSSAIEKQEDVPVQLEALDILSDLLSRFGPLMINFHGTLLVSLLPQLTSSRQAVRKKTIVALSLLVMSCNYVLYSKLIDVLLEGLTALESERNMRTYVQCIASVCRQAGHRFGEHIERVMPIIKQYSCSDDDEVREYCLQALEAFIQRCPKESTPHIADTVNLCLSYVTYDPNYNYDDEDSPDGSDNGNMETEETDDDENDEYSDDDDMSWKVRRSAAKCLEAIISTRHELLLDFYKSVSPKLISRFKEREENVKSDIFHAYVALLKATRPSVGGSMDPDGMDQEEGPVSMLQTQVPALVKAIQYLMKDKSIKTRQDCFVLLKELVTVLPGALTNHIPAIIPGIQFSMGDKYTSSNNKIDALGFLHCLLTSHPPEVFHPYMTVLAPLVIKAVGDSFYKITAEGLFVLQQLVKVIRPLDIPACAPLQVILTSCLPHPSQFFIPLHYNPNILGRTSSLKRRHEGSEVDDRHVQRRMDWSHLHAGEPTSTFDFVPYIQPIYLCTLTRLRAADIDQEVKERAISCMGQIISTLGDQLQAELQVCLPIFLDRLRNEITRLRTVRALNTIAASILNIDLRPMLEDALPLLGSFLRKNQRNLKLSTLMLLDSVVLRNYPGGIDNKLLNYVLVEVPSLLKASDLHISQMTLTLLASIAQVYPSSLADTVAQNILPDVLELAKSSLLQGAAMNSMLDFFKALVKAGLPGLGYRELLAMLVLPITHVQGSRGTLHKQAFHSLASCVAVLTICCHQEAVPIVEQFLLDLQNPGSDAQHIFALLVIGEIGRHTDLSSLPNLKHIILNSFTSPSEEIKSSASYALGSIALGNLPTYLPFILQEIASQPRRQYLLLNSLKEIIAWQSATPKDIQQLKPFVPDIWQQLFRHCECAEEGTRNVVAECLGKLALIDPGQLLPLLQESLLSNSALMRTTVVTAVKFTITDQPQPIDPMLRQCMSHFLTTLQDPDLHVRRVALVAFNSAAHNKPSLVRDLLDSILPQLYAETIVKKELIREVEMGPFKHTVDDGLDVRKAAFECMYTLLDTCVDRLDIFQYLNHVENGLRDHYDIKMLTYLMVGRLAKMCPSAVLQRLDRLIEPLRLTCTMKVKANSVKQEYEKQDELKRSAMRAVNALLKIASADKNPHLCEFVNQIKATPELALMFDMIQKDLHTTNQDASVSMDMS